MKLTRLVVRNVRNLRDGEYRFTHADGRPFDVVLVTGPSASGKTTFLEVIAMAKERVASYGRPAQPRAFLRRGENNGFVGLTLLLDPAERRRAQLSEPVAEIGVQLSGAPLDVEPKLVTWLASYSHEPGHGLFDYFPANRALVPAVGAEPPPNDAAEGRLRLGREPDKYGGVEPWLRAALLRRCTSVVEQLHDSGVALETGAPDSLAPFRDMLAHMCPWLRLHGVAADGESVVFVRQSGEMPTLFELSDGERDAVLWCASSERVGLDHSVVLIDRPEAHAHPNDVARWLSALERNGNQRIVATTSEALLRAVPAAQHIRLGS